MGAVKGGAIRFAKPAEKLWIAEGIESALSIYMATNGQCPIWSCYSLGNFKAIDFPSEVKELVLCFDADEKEADKANKIKGSAIKMQQEKGLKVFVAMPDAGTDFNDMIMGRAA